MYLKNFTSTYCKFSLFLLFYLLLLIPIEAKVPINLANEKRNAFRLLEERKFKESAIVFKNCAALDSKDPSVHYYLGVSSLYAEDFNTAEHAFCRTVVMTLPDNEFSKNALRYLKKFQQFRSEKPYSQQDSYGLSRWDRSRGPIKVHVTNGLKFPHGYSGIDLTAETTKKLYPYLKKPEFFKRLSTAGDYRAEFRSAVMTGINAWSVYLKDCRINMQYVDDPTKADILFVWCEVEGRGAAGRTFSPWTMTKDTRCIVHIETAFTKTLGNYAMRELTHVAMHEFGHALGLQNHSMNEDDVMYDRAKWVDENDTYKAARYNRPSRNDYVTLRALYELPVPNLYRPF